MWKDLRPRATNIECYGILWSRIQHIENFIQEEKNLLTSASKVPRKKYIIVFWNGVGPFEDNSL